MSDAKEYTADLGAFYPAAVVDSLKAENAQLRHELKMGQYGRYREALEEIHRIVAECHDPKCIASGCATDARRIAQKALAKKRGTVT